MSKKPVSKKPAKKVSHQEGREEQQAKVQGTQYRLQRIKLFWRDQFDKDTSSVVS
jgi:hypothetical protein